MTGDGGRVRLARRARSAETLAELSCGSASSIYFVVDVDSSSCLLCACISFNMQED